MQPAAQRKKARERAFLETFLRIANLPAKLLKEREAPDFLLEVEGRPVGLEVTEVFLQNDGDAMQPKVGEAIVDEIAARARRRYEEKGGFASGLSRFGEPTVYMSRHMRWVPSHPW